MSHRAIQPEMTEGYQRTPGIAEGRRFPFRLITAFILIAASWLAFSRFVVPAVIESAYRGESLAFLNSLISGQAIHPVEHYLAGWEIISWSILGILVMVGLILIPLLATRPEVQSYDTIKLFRVYALATTLNIVVFSSVYILVPELRQSFLSEDQFIENLTAALFFSAFLLGGISIARSKEKHHRVAYGAIPLMGLVGFLEELSYGERLFNINMPKMYGVKIDAVHDIFYLVYKVYCNAFLYLFLVAFCILILSIVRKCRIKRMFEKYPRWRFLPFFVGFGLIALIIDLEIVTHHFLLYIEELFEMNAALALLFATLPTGESRF